MVAILRPWRRLGPRVDPYVTAVRSRMDGGRTQIIQLAAPAPTASGVMSSVFGPIITALAGRLAKAYGHRDEASVALALDRAGITGVTPRAYVYQQLSYAMIGLLGGFAVGALSGARSAVMVGLAGCFCGTTRKRSELERRTKARRLQMQAELVDVCNLLAIYARVDSLQSAVATLCVRGRGEVIGDLRRVLAAVESGTPPEVALNRMSELSPEPAAAGLYRALSLAITLGGDVAETLLAQSANLRDRQRDARRERATKRTEIIKWSNATLMVLPLVGLIAAGFPYLFLGSL